MGRKLLLSAIFVLFATCVHAQWVTSAKSRAFSRSNSISVDNTGALYTGGTFTCITSFNGDSLLNNTCAEVAFPRPATPQIDGFLSKHDENGNLLWVNHYPGSLGNKLFINDVSVDNAGYCYVTGSFTGSLDVKLPPSLVNTELTTTFFLMRIRPDGVTDWKVSYPVDVDVETSAQKLSVTSSGVYITGYVRGKFQIGAYIDSVGRNASFVSAFGLTGNPLWTKNFMEVNANGSSYGKAIEAQGDSLWVFSSFTDSVRFENDTILPPASLATTGVICLFNAAGDLLDSVLTSTPFIEDIKLHRPDASLYLTGRAPNSTTIGSDALFTTPGIRAFVSSHDLDLTLKWVVPLTDGTSLSLSGKALDVNNNGNIIVGGTFDGTTLTAPNTMATGGGGQSGFIVKLDATGNDTWVQSMGGEGEDAVLSVASLDDDHIYASGYFNEYVRIVQDEIFATGGSSNGFMARVDVCPELLADMLSPSLSFVCAQDSLQLEVLNDAAYTYQWYLDGTLLPGAITPELFAKDSGSYAVEVNGLGCTKFTPPAGLQLLLLPDRNVITFDPLENCAGDSVRLTGSQATYKFDWTNSGVPIILPFDTINTINVKTNGDYAVKITDSLACFVLSDTFKIRFHDYPTDVITPPGKHTICAGDSIAFQADTSLPDMKYSWRKNNITLPLDTLSLFYAKEDGVYTVVASNAVGCKTISLRDTVGVQAAPFVDVRDDNLPSEICQGEFVQLTTLQVIGQTYQWIRNTVDMPGAATNTLNATLAGNYLLRVRSGLCEAFSDPFNLTINPLPTAAIVNNAATSFCEGGVHTLHAQQSSLYNYQWLQNSQVIPGASLHGFAITQTGNYSVRITNQFNCETISPSTLITVNTKPPATLTPQGPTTFCIGNTVELRANAGTGLTYQWSRNGTDLTGETLLNLQASNSGAYAVTVTNGNTCQQTSAVRAVEVISIPEATLITANGSLTICERDSLMLVAGNNIAYTYSWILNDQPLSSFTSQQHYIKLPGAYKIVASVGTCRDTSSVVSLSLRPNPKPIITRDDEFLSIALFGDIQWHRNSILIPGARQQAILPVADGNYTVSVLNTAGCLAWSDDLAMCFPVPVIQKKNDILAVSIADAQYSWRYKGIIINGAAQQQIKAQQSGNYSVVVTNSNGCVMETYPVTVCIPFPSITRDDFSGVLKALPNPASAYQWYYNDQPVADGKTQIHIPDENGSYTVAVTDLEGCTSMSEPFVIHLVTATDGDVLKAIMLYPNPVTNELTIKKLTGHTPMVVTVIDAIGHEIYKQQTEENFSSFDFTGKSAGVYTVIIQHEDGVGQWKLIKH